jgi:hypothetical protein
MDFRDSETTGWYIQPDEHSIQVPTVLMTDVNPTITCMWENFARLFMIISCCKPDTA